MYTCPWSTSSKMGAGTSAPLGAGRGHSPPQSPGEAEQQRGPGSVTAPPPRPSTAEHQPGSPTVLGGNISSHRLNIFGDREAITG